MNRPLAAEELQAMEAAFPVTEPKLTRKQKLLRLAERVATWDRHLALHTRLEHCNDEQLSALPLHSATVFGRMADDEVFIKDGFNGGNLLAARNYLELTTPEMHTFSCDCGGSISNADMADRIRKLAG